MLAVSYSLKVLELLNVHPETNETQRDLPERWPLLVADVLIKRGGVEKRPVSPSRDSGSNPN